jgi:hypothetical protein
MPLQQLFFQFQVGLQKANEEILYSLNRLLTVVLRAIVREYLELIADGVSQPISRS